jgi:hemoglobin/transferrin/lactoferrin receptor protein
MPAVRLTIFIFFLITALQALGTPLPPDTTVKKLIGLDEVIISVNKAEESKKGVAQQIQLLKLGDLEILQYQTTADLLAGSANLFVQKSQLGGGSPVIRGFEASRILLVIDGVRMNNLIYRAGHLQNIVTIDPSVLDRLEILYGPSSTIYGSDALGGVIHLYTRKPRLAGEGEKNNLGLTVISGYGSAANHFTEHFNFNLGGSKIASFTAFTYSSFGDLKGGKSSNPFYKKPYGERIYYQDRVVGKDTLILNADKYRQIESGYSQYDFLQKFLFRPGRKFTHSINLQYSTSTDVPRYDRLTDPNGTGGLKYAEWYYGPQRRLLTAYEMNFVNAASFFQSAQLNLNYQQLEESRHTRRFNATGLQRRYEKVNVSGINFDLQRYAGKHRLHLGFDGQYSTVQSTAREEDIVTGAVSGLDTRYPGGDNSMKSVAVYLSHTYKIAETLSLTDGFRIGYEQLRAEFTDTTFFRFPFRSAEQDNVVYSASAGLIHSPGEKWKMSLLVSSGFRVPNIDDLGKVFESAPGMLIVPNAGLKPEKTINAEAGITKVFGGKAVLEQVIYYTRFFDAIVTDFFTYEGSDSVFYDGSMSRVLANQNKQKAYLYGFSTALRAQAADDLLLAMQLNYTYGRIETDSSAYPLDHIPPFMMQFHLEYNRKKFKSDFAVTYNGWKRLKDYYLNGEDNEQYATPAGMPAWIAANLHLGYDVHPRLALQAGIDNLLDTQYRTFSSGINAPGRNFTFGIKYRFTPS